MTRSFSQRCLPVRNLDMLAMTLVFQVKDPAFLDQLQAGDKVNFPAERAAGALVVTQIEAVEQ